MKYVTLCIISYQWGISEEGPTQGTGGAHVYRGKGISWLRHGRNSPVSRLLPPLAAMVAMVGCSSEQKSEEATDEKAATETTAEPVELQVFAANSLSKAMEEVQAAYIEDGHSNVTFADTQYKSSGELNEMLGAAPMPTC